MIEDPEFMTVAEVASLLRASKMTVYRLIHDLDLEAFKIGRSFRIRETSVKAFIAKSKL